MTYDAEKVAREWYEQRSEGIDVLDASGIPSLAALLDEARAPLLEELERYQLLRRAVNESENDCTPECDGYGHREECKTHDPAAWLVALQGRVEALLAAIREAETALGRVSGTIGGRST